MEKLVICSFYFMCSSLLLVSAGVSFLTEQPSYLPSCQIKKPGFTNCSTKSIQAMFDTINEKGGLPGLETLPPLDPLAINKIKINQGGSEAVNIKVELSKVSVGGFKNIKIVESRVSSKDYSWQTKILIPKMKIDGNYALQGRILLLNLNGRGKMSLEIENINILMRTTTTLYEKGGLTFYNVTSTKVDYTLTKLRARFDNLFNGNKELEDSTNLFFNENWETLAEALKPVIQKTIADILLDYLQRVFHFIPAEYFVTDIPTPKELYGE